jgi:hypothetical protein
LAVVDAILYDNRVITVERGLADVTDLKPGEDSAFVISLYCTRDSRSLYSNTRWISSLDNLVDREENKHLD